MFSKEKSLNLKNKLIIGAASTTVLASTAFNNVEIVQAQGPEIDAKSSVTIDYDTGQILQGHEIDEPMEIASMTKMIVEYIVFEELDAGNISWDTEITISDYAYEISQNYALSNVPLRNGENYTLQELYEAMAIYSANGATIAIAEAIEGSEPNFVDRMIKTVESFDVEDAKLVNSTGLNNKDLAGNHYPDSEADEENVMSARSVAIITDRIIRDYPDILEISSVSQKTFREDTADAIEMTNWNLMLEGLSHERAGVDGLKTGTTEKAGATFTGTGTEDDRRLITVVMDSGDGSDLTTRFSETDKMMDYGFDDFSSENVTDQWAESSEYEPLEVVNGKEDEVNYEPSQALEMLIESNKDIEEDITYEVEWNPDIVNEDGTIEAPLKEDTELGHLVINYSGNELGYLKNTGNKVPLVTTESVDKANIFSQMWHKMTTFVKDIAGRF